MKTLGIIGGMSPESTEIYYRDINRLVNQAAGGNRSAPIVMLSVDFEEIVRHQKNGAWQQTAAILSEAARKLESIGAEGILLATNTMHKNAEDIAAAISVPFLHILDAAAQAIQARQLRKIGVLGTAFTMQDNFYRKGLAERGIEMLVPETTVQTEIHRIIFEELCLGKILPQSRAFYLDAVQALAAQGAEGIILGCTEIGLLIRQEDHHLPFFDTAALHAQAAADFVLSD